MTTHEDARIVLRAVITMRGLQIALDKAERRTPEYARLFTAVRQMEEQVDLALESVGDLIRDYVANDD